CHRVAPAIQRLKRGSKKSAITLKQFKALVKSGDMKYYLSSGRSGNSKIEAWVEKVGNYFEAIQSTGQKWRHEILPVIGS
ncbi:hypothetical protein, partial [Lacticaseibacillus rhamnosus]|uniref:hypothetical protein n=1 Tax=Lacticaseibacillus rhamnosus TaxID=47715 RepID=UPI003A599917